MWMVQQVTMCLEREIPLGNPHTLHNKKKYYFLYSIFAYNLGIFTFMTLNNYLIQFKILKYKHFNHFYKTKKSEVTG